jgi:hypothetical protein
MFFQGASLVCHNDIEALLRCAMCCRVRGKSNSNVPHIHTYASIYNVCWKKVNKALLVVFCESTVTPAATRDLVMVKVDSIRVINVGTHNSSNK